MTKEIHVKEKRLFGEFHVPTYEEWRQLAEKTLKGGSFEERLVTETYEGIPLKPMYRKEDIEQLPHISTFPGEAPYVRGTKPLGYQEKPWEVCQELAYGTPEQWNAAAQQELKRGQTMLNLVLAAATAMGQDPDQGLPEDVGVGGLSIHSMKDLTKALEGINLEQTPILIQAGVAGLPLYSMLIAFTQQQGSDLKKLRGCVGMDPLGTLAKRGALPVSMRKTYDWMARYTLWAKDQTPEMKTIFVQSEPYHNAGGNAVQELAFALASGVEYVRQMQEKGLSIGDIAPRMLFSFSIGTNFFMELAKLRAARLLWAKIIEAFGGSEEKQKMFIHARTSAWTKTVHDPHVNLLRATTEAFAAVMGGIDSLHVSTFDEAVRPSDEFSRRIAKNTHLILEKEAHLSKVIDPAGGSWYVESLTHSLAKRVWELFQQIEGQGGMVEALETGFVQEQVADIATRRFLNIGRRMDKFVGTNLYPDLSEVKLTKSKVDRQAVYQTRCAEVNAFRSLIDEKTRALLIETLKTDSDRLVEISIRAFRSGLTLGEWTQSLLDTDVAAPTIQPLRIHRAAESFEALRKNAEAYKEKTGSFAKVFLANMGPIPHHKPRSDFATGFFEVGGFEVISNPGFATVEQAAQAALASGASIVVICLKDETYPELVPPLARLLKQADPKLSLFVVGDSGEEQAESFKLAGVDEFIHLRSQCYDVLFRLQQQKGMGQ